MSRLSAPGRVVARCLALALRALAATWRIDDGDVAELERVLDRPGPLLVGFWHGVYFPLIPILRCHAARIFIGEGLRGRWIAALCEAMGFSPVMLPHHDRRGAVARMREALQRDLPCATPLDGPHGPVGEVKPALIQICGEVGAAILPVSLVVAPRLALNWRWDHRIIAMPFARIRIFTGEPVPIPEVATASSQTALARRVAAAVDALPANRLAFEEASERAAGHRPRAE